MQSLLATVLLATALAVPPGDYDRNPKLTPGGLCTAADPDFDEYRYAERIPHCRRNVSQSTKVAVGESYGIHRRDLPRYEVDHWQSLGLGGNNHRRNLWPIIKHVARQKAAVEQRLYNRISRGEITQAEALAELEAWRPAR